MVVKNKLAWSSIEAVNRDGGIPGSGLFCESIYLSERVYTGKIPKTGEDEG